MAGQLGKYMCPEVIYELSCPAFFGWPKMEFMKPRYTPMRFWGRGGNDSECTLEIMILYKVIGGFILVLE